MHAAGDRQGTAVTTDVHHDDHTSSAVNTLRYQESMHVPAILQRLNSLALNATGDGQSTAASADIHYDDHTSSAVNALWDQGKAKPQGAQQAAASRIWHHDCGRFVVCQDEHATRCVTLPQNTFGLPSGVTSAPCQAEQTTAYVTF